MWGIAVLQDLPTFSSQNVRNLVPRAASAPGCVKSDAYLARQLPSFLEGQSPPDFPADHFEVGFAGRAAADDLTPLGRSQMGFVGSIETLD
jgi:hypothetical protein